MLIVVIFLFFGFLLSAAVATKEVKSLLSIVSIVNIFFFLGYVIRPLIIIYYFDGFTYRGLNIVEEPDSLIISLAMANYFYLFFALGVLLTNKKFSTDCLNLSSRSEIRLSIILMILGLSSYIFYLYFAGFFSGGFLSLFEYIYGQRGFYYFRLLSFLFIFGVFGYLAVRKVNPFSKLILVLIAILISISFYARQHFIIFSALAFHLYGIYTYKDNTFQRSFKRIVSTVLMATLLLYSMVFMLNARTALSGGDDTNVFFGGGNQIELIDYIANSGQITYLDFGISAMHYQQSNNELAAHSLGNLLLMPVPSALYPNKPKNFNRALAEYIPDKTPPSPAFGFNTEIYFNFPYIYILVGPIVMFFTGVGFKKLFLSMQENYSSFMLYLFVYSSFFMFIRSGLFSSVGVFLEKIIPFLIIIFLYKLIFFKKKKLL